VHAVLPSTVRPFDAASGTPSSESGCTPDRFRFVAQAPMTLVTDPVIAGRSGVTLDPGEHAECDSYVPFVAWSLTSPGGTVPGPAFWGYKVLASSDAV
jgi:hypothetical protein